MAMKPIGHIVSVLSVESSGLEAEYLLMFYRCNCVSVLSVESSGLEEIARALLIHKNIIGFSTLS